MALADWLMPPAPAALDLNNPDHHWIIYGTEIVGCGPFELFNDITRAKEHYTSLLRQRGVERVSRIGADVKRRWELSPREIEQGHVHDDCEVVIRVWCEVVKAPQTD